MRSMSIILAALAVVVGGVNVHASGTGSPAVDDLRAAKERIQQQASQTKGGPQQLLLMKRQSVSSLIERLERGESVDPAEIDRLLEEPGLPTR